MQEVKPTQDGKGAGTHRQPNVCRGEHLLAFNSVSQGACRQDKDEKGRVAAVDIRERSKLDRLMLFITQVAAISCADTKVPETTVATQSLRKVGFCKARQLEVSVIVTEIITSSKIHQLDAAAISAEIALFDGNDRTPVLIGGCQRSIFHNSRPQHGDWLWLLAIPLGPDPDLIQVSQ